MGERLQLVRRKTAVHKTSPPGRQSEERLPLARTCLLRLTVGDGRRTAGDQRSLPGNTKV